MEVKKWATRSSCRDAGTSSKGRISFTTRSTFVRRRRVSVPSPCPPTRPLIRWAWRGIVPLGLEPLTFFFFFIHSPTPSYCHQFCRFYVVATQAIPKGTWLTFYAAQAIQPEDDVAGEKMNFEDDSLVILQHTPEGSQDILLSPKHVANASRFFSHFTDQNANLEAFRFAFNGKACMAFRTKKKVVGGQSLGWNYNGHINAYDTTGFQ